MPTEKIKFTLHLPNGPKSTFVSVAGGADADRDGKIETDSEVKQFLRSGAPNTWVREQVVNKPLAGMKFAVNFRVGADVEWELVVTDSDNKQLYKGANTTTFIYADVQYSFS